MPARSAGRWANPIPLQAETTSDAVIIKETDVAAGSRFFKP